MMGFNGEAWRRPDNTKEQKIRGGFRNVTAGLDGMDAKSRQETADIANKLKMSSQNL